MGRGKVELKKIENKISRQVTFSKRRTGLLKKAREISVLCDANVALMVFSTKGKLCQYASDSSSMEKILDRYEQYANAERQLTAPDPDSFARWSSEHEKVKARLETIEKTQRHYMGEELDTLSLRELQNVEHQLDNALKHIRSKKNHLMYESISELQKKDKAMRDHNDDLSKKGKEQEQEQEHEQEQENENENENALVQHDQWDKQQHDLRSPSFFASRVLYSSDTRGSYESGSSVVEDEATRVQNKSNNNSTTMPAWMLSHIADQ